MMVYISYTRINISLGVICSKKRTSLNRKQAEIGTKLNLEPWSSK